MSWRRVNRWTRSFGNRPSGSALVLRFGSGCSHRRPLVPGINFAAVLRRRRIIVMRSVALLCCGAGKHVRQSSHRLCRAARCRRLSGARRLDVVCRSDAALALALALGDGDHRAGYVCTAALRLRFLCLGQGHTRSLVASASAGSQCSAASPARSTSWRVPAACNGTA